MSTQSLPLAIRTESQAIHRTSSAPPSLIENVDHHQYLHEEATAIMQINDEEADEALNDYFRRFFLTRQRHHNVLLESIFRVPHTCPAPEDDPLFGIFKTQHSCCSMRDYLDMPTDLPMHEARRRLTQFGQRLHGFDLMFEIQIDNMAAEYWMQTDRPIDREALCRILKATTNHTDSDNVNWCFDSCSVCFADCRFVCKPPCCQRAICCSCWSNYVKNFTKTAILAYQLTGSYNLQCYACSKLVPYSQALARTEPEDVAQIRPHALLSSENWTARCPVCLKSAPPVISSEGDKIVVRTSSKHIGRRKLKPSSTADAISLMKKLKGVKGGHPFTCDRCGHAFCRLCGNANHALHTCHEMTASDAGLRLWSKQKGNFVNPDFPNGRTCPFCGIMVSHSGGCPHMKCVCGSEFCFSCGRKYYDMPFLRNHSSTKLLPLISCPKQWKSKRQRIFVHSLISLGLVLGVAPVFIGLAPIALPAVFTYYLVEKHKRKKTSITF